MNKPFETTKFVTVKSRADLNDWAIDDVDALWQRMQKIAVNCGQCNVSLYRAEDGSYHAGFVENLAIGSAADLVLNLKG